MIKLCYIAVFLLSINSVVAQDTDKSVSRQDISKTVRREVLFIQHFGGKFKLPPPTGKMLQMGNMEMDQLRYIMLPYSKRKDGTYWPFREYLVKVNSNPFLYYFNEVFLSSHSFNQEYIKFLANNDAESSYLDLSKLAPANTTYLLEKWEHILANVWIVDAEWTQITVDETPRAIAGLMPRMFVYPTYDVFVLKNILSISPVDSSFTGRQAHDIEYRTDIPRYGPIGPL